MRALLSIAALGAFAVAAGCSSLDPIERPAPVTGTADFSNYVAVGTSISLGIESGSLNVTGQGYSFPSLIAQATNVDGGAGFVQPLVALAGIPPVLELVGFTVEGQRIIVPRPGPPPSGPFI